MKYLAVLKEVCLDINGGEYSEILHNDLHLGIIEADNNENALEIAKILEEDCYKKHYGKNILGYPQLSVEELESTLIKLNNYRVKFLGWDKNEYIKDIKILNNFYSYEEEDKISEFLEEKYSNFRKLLEFNSID